MDKQTLSNYGWLVIVTLILAVMLALATPFGTYVGDGVVSIANGYVATSNNAIDEDNIQSNENIWDTKLQYGVTNSTSYYFNTLSDAIYAVNNNDYTKASNKTGSLLIVKNEDTTVLKLLNDITESQIIEINNNLTMNLNNHTLSLCDNGLLKIKNGIQFNIQNGKIAKQINSISEDRAYTVIYLESNTKTYVENIKANIENNGVNQVTFILLPSADSDQVLTLNNCDINVQTNESAIVNGDEKGQWSRTIFSNADNVTFNMKNCNTNVVAPFGNNVYFKSGSFNITGGTHTTATNFMDTDALHPFVYTINIGSDAVGKINNANFTFNNSLCVMPCVIHNSGILELNNIKAVCNSNHSCTSVHYSYVTATYDTSTTSGVVATTTINNCDFEMNASLTQTSAVRVQNGATVHINDSKFTINFNKVAGTTGSHIPYAIFLNASEAGNTCNIKNSYIKAPRGYRQMNGSSDVYNEFNVTYECDVIKTTA